MLSKPMSYNYIPYNANISVDNNNIQIIQQPSHEVYKSKGISISSFT